MTFLKRSGLVALSSCFALASFLASPAIAQVVDIDQAAALAGGVTPGDTPGFPVTLSESGAYRLTSNLNLNGVAGVTADTSAIEVTRHNVTIHMDGFEITGIVLCSGHPKTCSPATASSAGVDSSQSNVAVFGGTIHRMGSGVSLGNNATVRNVRAISNTDHGIIADGHGALVAHCLADANGTGIELVGSGGQIVGNVVIKNGNGIVAADYSVISGNSVFESGGMGIFTGDGSVATGNVVAASGGTGISAGEGAMVSGNTASSNDAGIYASDAGLVQDNIMYNNTETGLATTGTPAFVGNVVAGSTVALEKLAGPGAKRTGVNLCNGRKRCKFNR